MSNSKDFKPGDIVTFIKPFYWYGQDIGGYTGVVENHSESGYILVSSQISKNSLVKCFNNEVRMNYRPHSGMKDFDLEEALADLEDLFRT